MFACEGGDLAAVSANGHRTPAAAVCARFVVKEEAATGIGTKPQACARTLGNELRRRTGYGSQQPIEAAFARYEFDSPDAILVNKFVVSLGDAEYFVDGLGPFTCYLLLAMHGTENLTERASKLARLQKQSSGGLGIGLRQSQKLGTAFRGDDARGFQEENELLPG